MMIIGVAWDGDDDNDHGGDDDDDLGDDDNDDNSPR